MNRRGFLKLLGSAVAVGTAGLVAPALIEEPRRRIWQVGRNAPVGGRRVGAVDLTFDTEGVRRWLSERLVVQEARGYAGDWEVYNAHPTHNAVITGIRPQALDLYADESTVDALFSSMDHETLKLWRDASNARGGILTLEGLQAAIDRAAERVAANLASFGKSQLPPRGCG